MNVTPSSRGETRTGFIDSPVIGRKADSPTSVPNDCILRRTALLPRPLVFIYTPTTYRFACPVERCHFDGKVPQVDQCAVLLLIDGTHERMLWAGVKKSPFAPDVFEWSPLAGFHAEVVHEE